MKTYITLLAIFAFFSNQILFAGSTTSRVFWRDYDGTIPQDAIIGNLNNDGTALYIGQAYIIYNNDTLGVNTVEVHEGQTIFSISSNYKVMLTDKFVQILCGFGQYLHWVSVNSTTDLNTFTNKTLVRGGYAYYWGNRYEYIGKITNEVGTFIGRATYDNYNGNQGLILNYVNGGPAAVAKTGFEVLVSD